MLKEMGIMDLIENFCWDLFLSVKKFIQFTINVKICDIEQFGKFCLLHK